MKGRKGRREEGGEEEVFSVVRFHCTHQHVRTSTCIYILCIFYLLFVESSNS